MTTSPHSSKYFVATSEYLVPIITLVLALAAIYTLYFSPVFKVSQILCTQDVSESCQNTHLLAEHNHFLGHNLFLLNLNDVKTRALQADQTIREIKYQKTLPSTLVIDVQSVYPTLALGTVGVDRLFVLDDDYRVIKTSTEYPHVPVVLTANSLSHQVGERLGDDLLRLQLSTCLAIAKSIPGTTKFLLNERDITVELEGGALSALFTTERPLDTQLNALHAVRQGVTISNRGVVIDLRYQQPIIKNHN